MEGVVQVLFIFGTIVTGDDNGCAGGETHKKAHNQIYHLSGRAAYGSEGSGSHESSHHYCVRCVVKLLKQQFPAIIGKKKNSSCFQITPSVIWLTAFSFVLIKFPLVIRKIADT